MSPRELPPIQSAIGLTVPLTATLLNRLSLNRPSPGKPCASSFRLTAFKRTPFAPATTLRLSGRTILLESNRTAIPRAVSLSPAPSRFVSPIVGYVRHTFQLPSSAFQNRPVIAPSVQLSLPPTYAHFDHRPPTYVGRRSQLYALRTRSRLRCTYGEITAPIFSADFGSHSACHLCHDRSCFPPRLKLPLIVLYPPKSALCPPISVGLHSVQGIFAADIAISWPSTVHPLVLPSVLLPLNAPLRAYSCFYR